jgi:hypothetical protein
LGKRGVGLFIGLALGSDFANVLSLNIPDVLQHYDSAFSHMFSSPPFLSQRLPERPVTGQYTLMKLICACLRNTSFLTLVSFIDNTDCLYLNSNDTHYSVVLGDSKLLEVV